jgi:amino-acid N-acetyltransferase
MPAIRALLCATGLPVGGLEADALRLMVAEWEGVVVGVGGLEVAANAALLRSVAVAPASRGQGVAGQLVRALLALAWAAGIGEVWLLTETADAYFPRHGFRAAPRDLAPASIQATSEFAALCPESAIAMVCREGARVPSIGS